MTTGKKFGHFIDEMEIFETIACCWRAAGNTSDLDVRKNIFKKNRNKRDHVS